MRLRESHATTISSEHQMRRRRYSLCAYDGWNANSTWCRGTDPTGGHWANHPRPHGEHIPTPDNAPDPAREASLSPHRQQ